MRLPYSVCVVYDTLMTVLRDETVNERITVDPKVRFGKPCVAGTRITVQDVLELVGEGHSFEEIIKDYYPDLAIQDIQDCIRYAIALIAADE